MQKSPAFSLLRFPLIFAALIFFGDLTSQTFPPGFSQVKVGTVYYPTALAKTPDGRIFVCEKAGRVKVVKNGVILSTAFVQLNNVEETNERGLGGIAIDPDFTGNHYVYLYYTTTNPVRNRLSRFIANGDVAQSGSETVLVEFEANVNSIHNGGGMAFGPDGKLYLAMGDDKVSSNAQSLSTHKGKLLRMNRDGSPAAGNPFSGSTAAARIWAYGFRNPFSISIDPGTGKIFVNDVGEGAWEEINDATTMGKNFGWPGSEGNSTNPAYTNPVLAYHHTNGTLLQTGCAVSGGGFFRPSSTNYPTQYIGKYFYVDYCNDWINYITTSGGTPVNFASNVNGAPIGVLEGPDGNLYYMSIAQSGLYKIVYNGGAAPVITQQPSSQTVSAGQQAVFVVGASGAGPLQYQWTKNGVNIQGANSATYIVQNAQTTNQGQYRVVVSNGYGSMTSSSASLTVTGFNGKPVASISLPAPGSMYRGGDTIYFSGNATDNEDGTLAASAFTWVVQFHHDAHIHPGPNIPQGVKSGSFIVPTTGESSANVKYRLVLYVRDSQNGRDTVTRDVLPHTTKITFRSSPPGMQIAFEGQPKPTTYTILAVERMKFSMEAPSPQSKGDSSYAFVSWQHGGPASQTITVPANDATYTAQFDATGTASCAASGQILREYWSNITTTSVNDIPVGSAPTGTNMLTIFEGPVNSGDRYGSRIRGFICAPVTGTYNFYIASDNSSELWLSTDDNPQNKKKIAYVSGYTLRGEWTKYPEQKSAAIPLVKGNRYYVEVLHRENDQGDHVAVGWKLPNGIYERPIPGKYLSPPSGSVNPPPPVSCAATGYISREVWTNVQGTDVTNIPLTTPPAIKTTMTQFKTVSNSGDYYGERIRGYICPPTTGSYVFWISSDDNSELYLGSNESPSTRQRIAFVKGYTASQEYTKYPSQQSSPVTLQANKKYYIEALHKEGTQGDNLSVGWQLPGGALERPIPGSRLSPFSEALQVSITAPPDGSTAPAGSQIVIEAAATGGSGSYSKMEFFNGSIKLGEDYAAPFAHTIASAQSGTYHLTAKVTDSGGGIASSQDHHIFVSASAACTGTGYITRELWNNVTGTSVGDIPVSTQPSTKQQLNIFRSTAEIGDNYGQRFRGYICPPVTGAYEFYISSDDNSELWLGTGSQPSSKQLIASVYGWTFPEEWYKYPSQKSAAVMLTAGTKYYIEALHKEGDQGDHLAVGWKLPGGALEQPIPGKRLVPFEEVPVAVCEASIQPGSSTTFCNGGSVKLVANQGAGFNYQWKKNDIDIPGATSRTLHVTQEGSYQVKIFYAGCNAWSAPTYVTVNDYLTARITPGGPTTFCEGENVKLYGNTCDDYLYQWKLNGDDIPGANSHSYVATQAGDYQLKIISGSSISWSALQTVEVNPCGSARIAQQQPADTTSEASDSRISDPSPSDVMALSPAAQRGFNLRVFPNPTTGMFTFDYCIEETKSEIVEVKVISVASGKLVYVRKPELVSGCVQANIGLSGDLPVGVYVLQIVVGEKTESTKLILCRQ
jgi:glucose/arabinose dehydrogenase